MLHMVSAGMAGKSRGASLTGQLGNDLGLPT